MNNTEKLAASLFLVKSGARGDQLMKIVKALAIRMKHGTPESSAIATNRLYAGINGLPGLPGLSRWPLISGSRLLSPDTSINKVLNIIEPHLKKVTDPFAGIGAKGSDYRLRFLTGKLPKRFKSNPDNKQQLINTFNKNTDWD